MGDFSSKDSEKLFSSAANSMFVRSLLHYFDMILYVDLHRSLCSLEAEEKFINKKYSAGGEYDDFVELTASLIHTEFRGKYIEEFSGGALMTAFYRGSASYKMECKFLGDDGYYHWLCIERIFAETESLGKAAVFVFFRLIDLEKKKEYENELFRELFYLTARDTYEYVVLIDRQSGIFETKYSSPGSLNIFPVFGDYENALLLVRNQFIFEEEKEDFYNKAGLQNITEELSRADQFGYTFRTKNRTGIKMHSARYIYIDKAGLQICLTISQI